MGDSVEPRNYVEPRNEVYVYEHPTESGLLILAYPIDSETWAGHYVFIGKDHPRDSFKLSLNGGGNAHCAPNGSEKYLVMTLPQYGSSSDFLIGDPSSYTPMSIEQATNMIRTHFGLTSCPYLPTFLEKVIIYSSRRDNIPTWINTTTHLGYL